MIVQDSQLPEDSQTLASEERKRVRDLGFRGLMIDKANRGRIYLNVPSTSARSATNH